MVAKNFKDLTGQKFGKLTVLHRCENDMYGRAKWFCKCDCGGFREVISYYLTKGTVSNCGCKKRTKSLTNYRKIKLMTVDEMAEYMCLMARTGIKATLNNIGISDKEIDFPPIEKSIEACKQILLQEVEQ